MYMYSAAFLFVKWYQWKKKQPVAYPPSCGNDVRLAVLLCPLLPSYKGMGAMFMGPGGRGRVVREFRGSWEMASDTGPWGSSCLRYSVTIAST